MTARLSRAVAFVRRWLWPAAIVAALGVMGTFALHPYPVGPKQPLPFSHRIHAGLKQISCVFCHDGVDRSSNAGLPEVGKCLLCHNVIIPNFEPIQKLHTYYETNSPIPWQRVYPLPDFVFFNHQMHIRRGVDCGHCHGDVKSMDRIQLNQTLTMGFCVDCHRKPEYNASVDCYTCHR